MALENIDKALAGLIDQINSQIVAQSPEAVALAGQVLQLKAQSQIALASAFWWAPVIALVSFVGWVAMSVYLHSRKPNDPGAGGATGVMAFLSFAVGIGALAIVAVNYINVSYNFALQAAAKDARVAIAYAVLSKLDK